MFIRNFDRLSTGTLRKLLSNTSFGSVQSLVEMGGDFAITIVIARLLGANTLGAFIYAKALIALLNSLLSMGMTQVVIRNFAQREVERQHIISNSLTIRLFFTMPATLVVAFGISLLLPIDDLTRMTIWLVAIFNGLGNTLVLLNGAFQAISRFEFPLYLSIFHKLSLFGIAWLIPLLNGDLLIVLVGFIFVRVVLFFITLRLVKSKVIPIKLRFAFSEWVALIRQSLPLAFSDLSAVANGRADSVLLGTMKSVSDVAIYGAAYNLYLGLNGVINSLAIGGFPLLSKQAELSHKSAIRLSSRMGIILFIGTTLIALIGTIFAKQIILIVYGSELLSTYRILQILLVALIFSSLGKLCHFTLISIHMQKLVFWATVTGMLFNLGANLILIPRFGYLGAAYITLATEIIVFLLSFSLVMRQYTIEKRRVLHV
jgi:O-antigen/teichoic acid export membrane protein